MHAFTRGGPPTEGLMKIFRHPDFERLSLVPVRGRRRRKALTAGLAVVPIAFAFSVYAQNKQSNTAIEPTAGEWRTWVISSGKDYRVPSPPAPSDTRAELRNLAELISHNDEQTAAQIAYWDAGGPQYRWIDYISNRLLAGTATTAFPHRVYTYVALAMYDATIATWESKYYYRRSRPSELDRKLPTAVDVPDSPSYPSEHAAAAQAAASVLPYFLPGRGREHSGVGRSGGMVAGVGGSPVPERLLCRSRPGAGRLFLAEPAGRRQNRTAYRFPR
jgi:PAP2 superfamily protein